MNKFCVALVGGIGSGKSTVSKIFNSFGIDTVNADDLSKKLTGQERIKAKLKTLFGSIIFNKDGEVNRKKLGSIIFALPDKKKSLEDLLHPLIRKKLIQAIEKSTSKYCIIEIPVFKNKKDFPYINKVLSIRIDKDKQISQTKNRDNKTNTEVEKIINQQISNVILENLADDVIENNGTLTHLKQQCEALHQNYLSLSTNTKG